MANETFTVTETIVLKPGGGDADGDNVIDPGEIVRTTVTITNNSTTPTPVDAIGLQFSQTLNGMTLFDQVGLGDINVSPIAFGDSYTAIGNTLLEVGNATGQTGPQSSIAGHVTDNDLEFFGGTFTISAFQATSANLGTVTMITSGADMGSFTYVSAAGFTGTDTFTYTIRDTGLDGIAGNSDDLTSTATVTIAVANQVWYIDSAAAAGGNGTSTNPFNTIAAFNAAPVDGPNDYIYAKGTLTGALTLEASEQLIGTGNDLIVGALTLATSTGTNTLINNSTTGITLSTDNTIKGVTINGTANGAVGIQDGGGTVGTLVIDNVSLVGLRQGDRHRSGRHAQRRYRFAELRQLDERRRPSPGRQRQLQRGRRPYPDLGRRGLPDRRRLGGRHRQFGRHRDDQLWRRHHQLGRHQYRGAGTAPPAAAPSPSRARSPTAPSPPAAAASTSTTMPAARSASPARPSSAPAPRPAPASTSATIRPR